MAHARGPGASVPSPAMKMLLGAFLLLAAVPASAREGVQLGVRFVPQSTSLLYDTGYPLLDFLKVAPHDTRLRTAQGLGVLYHPWEHWSLGADLLYSRKGGGFASRQVDLDYLEVPLWLGFNTSSSNRLMFNVQAGLEVGYAVRRQLRSTGGTSTDLSDSVDRVAWGVPVAVGVRCRLFAAYSVNAQLFVSAGLGSLVRTNPTLGVRNYVFPGLRLSVDRELGVRR
ncbi:PorT family protein [Corallococcus llansteffanensis]|uniref:PorT family protein n=2 Tax=Corallococcus llansteffanensis TaxID=2316731 RepID=A0A3A8QCH8_9BACT|nr:PorT family protein [Corallococcus llansteffanensis]